MDDCQRLFVDQTFETCQIQKILKSRTLISGVCPDMVMFILRSEEAWMHLTVVEIGRSYRLSKDKAMVDIDADTVLYPY